jgi:hypothetical protein
MERRIVRRQRSLVNQETSIVHGSSREMGHRKRVCDQKADHGVNERREHVKCQRVNEQGDVGSAGEQRYPCLGSASGP